MDVRSVQDSGTMPLISEVILAVSVGCVEIRNTAANQEEDDMDSYQVARQALLLLRLLILTAELL